MQSRILILCLTVLLAASLCACKDKSADASATKPLTSSDPAASATSETTADAAEESFTTIGGFRVHAERDAFVWTGDVREGLAALEDNLAELHPAAGKFTATFGEVTLEMQADFMAENERIIEVTAASIGEHRIAFDAPRQTRFANGGIALFAVGGKTVLTYMQPFNSVENYVFDETGITSLTFSAAATDADYNEPVILLADGGDTLRFVCWPKKYACGYPQFAYFVGKDEVLEIEGTAGIADGKFSFSAEKQYSFADLNANGALDYAYFGNTGEDASALSSLMQENAGRYEAFTIEKLRAEG